MAQHVFRPPVLSPHQIPKHFAVLLSPSPVNMTIGAGVSVAMLRSVGRFYSVSAPTSAALMRLCGKTCAASAAITTTLRCAVGQFMAAIVAASRNTGRIDASVPLLDGDGAALLTDGDAQILVSGGFSMLNFSVSRRVAAGAATAGTIGLGPRMTLALAVTTASAIRRGLTRTASAASAAVSASSRQVGKACAAAGAAAASAARSVSFGKAVSASAATASAIGLVSRAGVLLVAQAGATAALTRGISAFRAIGVVVTRRASIVMGHARGLAVARPVTAYLQRSRATSAVLSGTAGAAGSLARISARRVAAVAHVSSVGSVGRDVAKMVATSAVTVRRLIKGVAMVPLGAATGSAASISTASAKVVMSATVRATASLWNGVYRVGTVTAGRIVNAIQTGARIINARTGREDR